MYEARNSCGLLYTEPPSSTGVDRSRYRRFTVELLLELRIRSPRVILGKENR